MLGYTLRRLAGALPTLFILLTLAFVMMRAAPGGPFESAARAVRSRAGPSFLLKGRSLALRSSVFAYSALYWSPTLRPTTGTKVGVHRVPRSRRRQLSLPAAILALKSN